MGLDKMTGNRVEIMHSLLLLFNMELYMHCLSVLWQEGSDCFVYNCVLVFRNDLRRVLIRYLITWFCLLLRSV